MVLIISEIGVNWEGDFYLARKMMHNSRHIGCDAVKFQAFRKETIQNHPESSRLIKSAISEENIEEIDTIAKEVGIEWFCTPMYPEAVSLLDPYVTRFKIRELDGSKIVEGNDSKVFLNALETGKEVIVSTQKSPENCQYFGYPKVKWLYCVPKYPSNILDHNFSNLKNFNGFSNHCPEIIVPLMASILGAEIIEVHLTPDKSKNYIDNNVSFDNNELKELVRNIRICESIKH